MSSRNAIALSITDTALKEELFRQLSASDDFLPRNADDSTSSFENKVRILITDQLSSARETGLLKAGIPIVAIFETPQAPQCFSPRISSLRKPFKFSHLLSLLHTLSQQDERFSEIRIGPFLLQKANKKLVNICNGCAFRLTEKEVQILDALYAASGAQVSRAFLLKTVWNRNSDLATRTLEAHIYRLRRKIETDPSRPALLKTETGGYRLVASRHDPNQR